MKKYGKGWFNESRRHSLARMGIKTSKRVTSLGKDIGHSISRLGCVNYSKEYIKGGLADGLPDSKFDSVQLKTGTDVELEHTNSRRIAKEIAKDHLVENPVYYDYLEDMENRFKEPIHYTTATVAYHPTTLTVGGKVVGTTAAKTIPVLTKGVTTTAGLSTLPIKSLLEKQKEERQERKRLDPGWIGRGVRKEAEFVGKVGKGIIGTVATGLFGGVIEPTQEELVDKGLVGGPGYYPSVYRNPADIGYEPVPSFARGPFHTSIYYTKKKKRRKWYGAEIIMRRKGKYLIPEVITAGYYIPEERMGIIQRIERG